MKRHKTRGPRLPPAKNASEPRKKRDSEVPDFFSAQVLDARRFYLNLTPSRSERLAVVSGGRELCAPDYRIRRPGFRYESLEFVARGEGWLRLRSQQHRLVPGIVFAYGPGVAHDIQNDPERPLVKYFVDFVGTATRRLLQPPAPAPGHITRTSSPDEVLRIFDDLVRTGLRDTPYSARICSALLEQLILKIAETSVPAGSEGALAFETYQRCRAFIEENYLSATSLGEIAGRSRVDPAYLCRLFARFDRQSPYQYLLRLKVGHAAQRLLTPGTLVKQVADELGFGDPFHFSRAFKRVLGVSPKHFVRMQRS